MKEKIEQLKYYLRAEQEEVDAFKVQSSGWIQYVEIIEFDDESIYFGENLQYYYCQIEDILFRPSGFSLVTTCCDHDFIEVKALKTYTEFGGHRQKFLETARKAKICAAKGRFYHSFHIENNRFWMTEFESQNRISFDFSQVVMVGNNGFNIGRNQFQFYL